MGTPGRPRVWTAFLGDVAVLVVFVLVGRRSHEEGSELAGFLRVLWPFLAALVLGWLVAGLGRRPLDRRRAAVAWAVTVVGGMVLRITAQHRELKPTFVLVTAVFVGAGMIGWRAVAAAIARRRSSRRRAAATGGTG